MNFRKRRNQPKLNIDITPLIDVIFLLLIFFMITTTFITAPGIHVKLPTASGKTNPENKNPIEITITEKSEIFINGKSAQQGSIKTLLMEERKKTNNDVVIIKADGAVKHQNVVDMMDAAKQAGINKISIATRPMEKPPRS